MMLAMQQQNLPHHDGHHVPIIASPMVTFSSAPASRLSTNSSQMRPSRPKLTLNTTVDSTPLHNVGKNSSLRLATLSAVSPTARNTLSNSYEKRSGSLTARPKLSIDPSVGTPDDFREFSDQNSSRTPSNSSISSASTLLSSSSSSSSSSEHSSKCYKLSKDIPSILINSFIPRSDRLSMSSESKRPLAMVKRVSFRDPLDEVIKTQTYTYANSEFDFMESETKAELPAPLETTPTTTSPSSLSSLTSPVNSSFNFQAPSTAAGNIYSSPPPRKSRSTSSRAISRRKSSPCTTTRTKRDSSDEESDDSYAQTPVAGRCKRRRDWTWTLDQSSDSKDAAPRNQKHDESAGFHDDDSMSITSRCTEDSMN